MQKTSLVKLSVTASIMLMFATASCGTDKEPIEALKSPALNSKPAEQKKIKGAVGKAPVKIRRTHVPEFQKIPPGELDEKLKQSAYDFATSYLENWKAGNFKKFGDEATELLQKALTVEKQKQAHEAIMQVFGEYQSLQFVEAVKLEGKPDFTVFRFRATYSKGNKPEIRVVFNSNGKVTGFWNKPWRDSPEIPKPVKLSDDEVGIEPMAIAKKLAADYLERTKAGKFEKLGDEATAQMKAALTPELQKQAAGAQKAQFGEYQSLKYVETLKIQEMTVFRFRGKFTRSEPEIRVVLDKTNKLAGFWIKPWMDALN